MRQSPYLCTAKQYLWHIYETKITFLSSGATCCHNNSKVESGGTLEINGGKVVNVIFEIQSGGTLKIDNHGQLIPVSDGMNDTYLNIPLGAILQFYEGSIQKSGVEFYQP